MNETDTFSNLLVVFVVAICVAAVIAYGKVLFG
ncbi:hypothetical protein HNR46_003325 [Haloferula luteola]|uniref:Uncharacterized protein n=1 Tax=Haloferula luteola TaxID=595692 RepID=A0A840V525_9BACT|nr:hypothetical protein [Haloferula luteola]